MADNPLTVDEAVGTLFRVTSDNGGPVEMKVGTPGGAAADITVHNILFVDAAASASGANGALNHPYTTIQAAVNAAAAIPMTEVCIKIAPGTYAETVLVPTATVSIIAFDGWTGVGPNGTTGLPVLTGGMEIQPLTGTTPPEVFFSNLRMTGTVQDSGSSDLSVHCNNVRATGSFVGGLVTLYLTNSDIGGLINARDDLFLELDGYSWGRLKANGTSYAGATKQFYDSGCDIQAGQLGVEGLAIGASQAVSFPHTGTVPEEFAIVTKSGTATDFQLVFSHTGTDVVVCIITNLSRVSTDFDDLVQTQVFHRQMQPA